MGRSDALRSAAELVVDGRQGTQTCSFLAKETLAALELFDLVEEWRSSKCSFPLLSFQKTESGEQCDGDNHQEECDVGRAMEDVLAFHNAWDV